MPDPRTEPTPEMVIERARKYRANVFWVHLDCGNTYSWSPESGLHHNADEFVLEIDWRENGTDYAKDFTAPTLSQLLEEIENV